MIISLFHTLCLFSLIPRTWASFDHDVVRRQHAKNVMVQHQTELLAKSVPLSQYLDQIGHRDSVEKVDRRMNENEGDDFYLDDDVMYSFSGFSLKFAQCQPVKYFSEDAIRAGEHSPMLTQDIVVLRLCPQKSCSSSTTYGCHYNYAEYAISLSDYLNIMVRYSAKKRESLCGWCDACANYGGRRKLEEDRNDENRDEENQDNQNEEQRDDENEENNQDEAEEQGNEEQDEQQKEQGQEAEEEGNDGNNEGNNYYNGDCEMYEDYCYNYAYMCGEGDDDNNMYIDYEMYMNYLECSQVDYNGYSYFVRPKCSSGKIEMAVYYDDYCVRAVEEVNIRDIGLNMKESVFQAYYSSGCIDCSESNEPPNFEYGSALCNNVHASSAKCTSDLSYDLFDGEQENDSECFYIETIRFGTYDTDGRLSSSMATNGWTSEVSTVQKIFLALSIFACVTFIVYACYLHHAMTNLLIKSLSHRELLPPSRHKGRRSGPYTRKGLGTSKSIASEPDWQKA